MDYICMIISLTFGLLIRICRWYAKLNLIFIMKVQNIQKKILVLSPERHSSQPYEVRSLSRQSFWFWSLKTKFFLGFWALYFSTDLTTGKIFCMCLRMYACVRVCLRSRGRNFYPISTKFGTQVG